MYVDTQEKKKDVWKYSSNTIQIMFSIFFYWNISRFNLKAIFIYRTSRHFPSNFDMKINKGTCLVGVCICVCVCLRLHSGNKQGYVTLFISWFLYLYITLYIFIYVSTLLIKIETEQGNVEVWRPKRKI